MLHTAPRLRISGQGRRLRVRQRGNWRMDQSAALSESCRASMAIDKAVVDAIGQARASGMSWKSIGRAFGATDDAESKEQLIEALANLRRLALQHLLREMSERSPSCDIAADRRSPTSVGRRPNNLRGSSVAPSSRRWKTRSAGPCERAIRSGPRGAHSATSRQLKAATRNAIATTARTQPVESRFARARIATLRVASSGAGSGLGMRRTCGASAAPLIDGRVGLSATIATESRRAGGRQRRCGEFRLS
jgi:hypothetical protein